MDVEVGMEGEEAIKERGQETRMTLTVMNMMRSKVELWCNEMAPASAYLHYEGRIEAYLIIVAISFSSNTEEYRQIMS